LIISALFGAITSYRTPLTRNINPAVSYAYQAGVQHLVEFLQTEEETKGRRIYIVYSGRRNLYAVSSSGSDIVKQMNVKRLKHFRMPAHLGIDEQGAIFDIKNPGYLMISAYDQAYANRPWSTGKHLPEDFTRLNEHPAWNNIYSSGDMTLWRWSWLVPHKPTEGAGPDGE
jgi:hypothetical protein